MKILHLCISAFFFFFYSYKENLIAKYHVKQGHDVTEVVYKEKDAKDTLYDYVNIINAEISKKREEFGLPLLEEE